MQKTPLMYLLYFVVLFYSMLCSHSLAMRQCMPTYLDGLQVPFHSGEFALQRHHSSQIVAKALSGFNHFRLFFHPGLDLVTLQVVVLDVKS